MHLDMDEPANDTPGLGDEGSMLKDAETVLVSGPTLFNRLWRGAVDVSPLEARLLQHFVERMPADFRSALRSQIRASNVVQRDPQWIELRFYTFVGGRVDRSRLPLLPVREGEVKLMSMTFVLSDGLKRHVNFWAVDRRFTMMNFDGSVEAVSHCRAFEVVRVRQSWRSNVKTDSGGG